MTTRQAIIADLQKLGLKTLGKQLDDLASDVVQLFSQAEREALQLPDQNLKQAGIDWATVCIESKRQTNFIFGCGCGVRSVSH